MKNKLYKTHKNNTLKIFRIINIVWEFTNFTP